MPLPPSMRAWGAIPPCKRGYLSDSSNAELGQDWVTSNCWVKFSHRVVIQATAEPLGQEPLHAPSLIASFPGELRGPHWGLFQEPKRNPKAKKSHEQRQRSFWTIRGGYRSLPIKTRVFRQITPESSPESSAKSLSQKFFGVHFLSLTFFVLKFVRSRVFGRDFFNRFQSP